MSRRRAAVKRDVLPDSRYSDKVVTKVINSIMLDGKKSIAEGIFYSAMDLIKEKTGQEGYDVFKQALDNIKPQIEVRSRRIGGATYQVPVEVKADRQQTLAIRWLTTYTRARKRDNNNFCCYYMFLERSQNKYNRHTRTRGLYC